MRILTVRNPWAWALVHSGKDVENRPRNIAGGYRGLVAIHAGQSVDDAAHGRASWPTLHEAMQRTIGADETLRPGDLPWQRHAGHIVGVAELVEVHDPRTPLFGLTGCQGGCSPWAEMGLWHLCFANARALAEPIPFTGALGLRSLAEATIARVLEGLR